jgi:hypothetical protein
MRKREIWDRLGPAKLMNALAFHQQDDGGESDELGMETSDGGEGGGTGLANIPLDALPEELRGLVGDPDKFRAGMLALQQAAAAKPAGMTAEELARAFKDAGIGGGNQPREKETEQPVKPVEELIYEDPRKAIQMVMAEYLGPRIQEFERFAGSTTLTLAGSKLPDFDQYSDDVQNILQRTGAPVNEANVRGAYLMVRGERALAADTTNKQARENTVRSSNGGQGDPNKTGGRQPAKLSDDEREVMRRSGFSDEKDFIKHRDSDFDVAVPMGDK